MSPRLPIPIIQKCNEGRWFKLVVYVDRVQLPSFHTLLRTRYSGPLYLAFTTHTNFSSFKGWLHDATLHAILRAIVSVKCGHPIKFDEIVARNVASVEFCSLQSAILRATMHTTISVVATRCYLSVARNAACSVASCDQFFIFHPQLEHTHTQSSETHTHTHTHTPLIPDPRNTRIYITACKHQNQAVIESFRSIG